MPEIIIQPESYKILVNGNGNISLNNISSQEELSWKIEGENGYVREGILPEDGGGEISENAWNNEPLRIQNRNSIESNAELSVIYT